MKDVRTMTYKELEDELVMKHSMMQRVDRIQKREIIKRDHELCMEMDCRWTEADAKRKAAKA